MIRWLSIAVMAYMILGIGWWGLLLYQKTQELYQVKLEYATSAEEREEVVQKLDSQKMMILGEGTVLVLSLLAGIYIINRSANREIRNARQQSDFLLSVSHELKSPIAAIKLALQTLNRKGLPEDKQHKFISSALEDSKRIENLVQNILVSANMVGDKLEMYRERIDLIPFVENLISKQRISDRIHLKKEANHIWVSADELFLGQAITNLIDNALKYSKDSEPVKIHLTIRDTDAKCIISNAGPMIPPKERKLIFERFYRGQSKEVRTKEGTGIGLYIAHQILLAHAGDITVDAADGYNHFTISLPANVA